MLKSINAWAFKEPYSFEEVLALAKKHGFDAVELNLDSVQTGHSFTMDTTDDELLEIKKIIDASGIKVETISSSLYWKNPPLGSHIPEKQEEAVKVLRHQLHCAQTIGAKAILVCTNVDTEIGLKASMDNTIALFRRMKDEIANTGVKVGLENVWNQFFMSPFDVKYVLDGIDDENVGLYFDIGNMVEFSEPQWWLDVIGDKVIRIHVKEYKRNGSYNRGGSEAPIFEGDVQWESVMQRLAKVGYSSTLTTEIGSRGMDFEPFLDLLSGALDKIIAMAK